MSLKYLLGQRIKELRLKKNMTQAQLAEHVSIDPKHQSCIENGRNFPSSDLLDKYAHVFEIDICDLLKIEHNKSRTELEKKLQKLIKNSSDEEFKIIYKIVNSLIK